MKRERHAIIQSRTAACLAAALGVAMAFAHMAPAATPWTHLNYQNNPDDFQFAIVPDRTGGDAKHAIAVHGGKDISICDLTLITDDGGGVKVDGTARNVQIEDSEHCTFRDWRKRE